MKNRQNSSISPLIIIVVVLVLAISCKKDDNEPSSGNSTNGKTSAIFQPSITYGTMTDQDGNVYNTLVIGTQTWMAENLRTTKYNDGTSIPNITDDSEWNDLTTGAYCNFDNTSNTDTIATFGRLYNWYAVNTGKLAPKGWHVPSENEWTILINYIGEANLAGYKLKETGTTHWLDNDNDASNESGFTALPGGSRMDDGAFKSLGIFGNWWSITEYNSGLAYNSNMVYFNSKVSISNFNKEFGFSVRCVKD